jgi:hypothetical protein
VDIVVVHSNLFSNLCLYPHGTPEFYVVVVVRKLSELKVMKQYHIEISNRSAALENLNDSEGINMAWENIKENIKTSAKESLDLYELKQHKLWFDEEHLGFLDQRKQAKMQWVQDTNQSSVDNLNNVRREASRYFRKNIEGISES